MSLVERRSEEARGPRSRYLLIFESFSGEKLGWWVSSSKQKDDLPGLIQGAANRWLQTQEGKDYIKQNELEDWGIDYANALRKIPASILFEYDILILDSFDENETVWLDPGENLLLTDQSNDGD